MASRKMKKRASGGKVQEYNAQGSAAMNAAKRTTDDGFKRGGKPHRKDGGKVEGEAAEERLDKRARGGLVGRARGGSSSPLSSGHTLSDAGATKGAGHEGERV